MKTNLLIGFLSISFLVSACGNKKTPVAGDEIELKLNLQKGKKYTMSFMMQPYMEMSQGDQTANMTTTLNLEMDYEVRDVLQSNVFVIRTTVTSLKARQEAMGSIGEYDSKTDKTSGPDGNTVKENFSDIVGDFTDVEIDQKGNIGNVMAGGRDPGKAEKGDGVQYVTFPDKKIKVGDTWTGELEQNVFDIYCYNKTTFKLVSVQNGIAEISTDGTLEAKSNKNGKLSGTQTGTIKVEIATGLTKEAVITQIADTEMYTESGMVGVQLTNKIKLNITEK